MQSASLSLSSLLPFPSPPVLFPPLYSPPSLLFPSPPLPLEVELSNPARGSGERCKLPQWGLGRNPSRNRFLVHFSPKIRHLVAKILTIFLRINLPNFMYFEVYQTWTGGDGNCFISRLFSLEGCWCLSLNVLIFKPAVVMSSGI